MPGIVFEAVFGLFLAAFLVLAAVTIRWAVRRDRQGRAAWLERQQEDGRAVHPSTNGHAPEGGRVRRRKPGRPA